MSLKKWTLLFVSIFLAIGCSQKSAETPGQNGTAKKDYYAPFYVVLEAHGGIENWNNQQTLSFKMGNQTQTIDLKSREIKVASPDFSMGNDDGRVWIQQDSANFKGSPTFYHSLMFYFHTMPFVLADDGINYEEVADKEIKGTTYKGIKMSFDENVGDAPKDEYILYYHPDTHKMEWLAYTSTYRSQQKSDSFNMIHYKTWEESNGFLLPTELQWYEYNNGEVGDTRGDATIFADVKVSTEKMPENFFDMPENAVIDSGETN